MDIKKITQEDINRTVWKACDTFRGVIDPSQYKDYILTMLFLKYVSDVYKSKLNEYLIKYNSDKERAERAMRHERFVVPERSSFDFLYDNRNATNIGELIDEALADLEDANREKMSSEDGSSIFRNISFNSANLGEPKEKNARLKNLLQDFHGLDLDESHLENNDIIGDAYMFLVSTFAGEAGKKAGDFFTPAEVSTLLAKLTKSKPGARICDITCGSGSLLIKAGKEVGNNNFSLYGQEVNGSTWALAMMNMFLHGFDNAVIRWGDTLRNPKLKVNDKLQRKPQAILLTAFGEAFHPKAKAIGLLSVTCWKWLMITKERLVSSSLMVFSSVVAAKARFVSTSWRMSTRWKLSLVCLPIYFMAQASPPPLPSSAKAATLKMYYSLMPAVSSRTERTKINSAKRILSTSSLLTRSSSMASLLQA